MTRLIPSTVVLMLVATSPLFAQRQAESSSKITARPAALQIVRSMVDIPKDTFEHSPLVSRMSQQPILVQVMLESQGEKMLIDIDDDASSLQTFADDTGRSLLQTPTNEGQSRPMSMRMSTGIRAFPEFSKDNTRAVIDIGGSQAPATGAKRIDIKASLSVLTAAGKTKQTLKDVTLEAGKLDLEGHQAKIKKVENREQFGKQQRIVSIEYRGDTADQIASLRMVDHNGQAIDVRPGSTMTSGSLKRINYRLKDKDIKSATLEFSMWKGFEKVNVPLDLSVSIGEEKKQQMHEK